MTVPFYGGENQSPEKGVDWPEATEPPKVISPRVCFSQTILSAYLSIHVSPRGREAGSELGKSKI